MDEAVGERRMSHSGEEVGSAKADEDSGPEDENHGREEDTIQDWIRQTALDGCDVAEDCGTQRALLVGAANRAHETRSYGKLRVVLNCLEDK